MMHWMSATLRPAMGRAVATRTTAGANRTLYLQVRDGQDAERVASRLHNVMNEDGIMKSLQLKRFHEKKWQKRKRKVEEQTIRHANRRIGSMIDFILQRKKAYVAAAIAFVSHDLRLRSQN